MKPVTFGIIGAGRIGKLHADNLLNRVDGARLKAITDPFLDEDWAASRNIPLTGKDHRILLDDRLVKRKCSFITYCLFR